MRWMEVYYSQFNLLLTIKFCAPHCQRKYFSSEMHIRHISFLALPRSATLYKCKSHGYIKKKAKKSEIKELRCKYSSVLRLCVGIDKNCFFVSSHCATNLHLKMCSHIHSINTVARLPSVDNETVLLLASH